MERRKFIKNSSLTGLAASIFPYSFLEKITAQSEAHLIQFSAASTQIRHGALNLPFAKFLKEELPFDWLLDVQQNIFFKDGFQRNELEDMHMMSVALKQDDHFETLQICSQSDSLSFLWKEEYVTIHEQRGLQTIEFEDENYTFDLIRLNEGESHAFSSQVKGSYFVQVINGQVENESNLLNNVNGLGIISHSKEDQLFVAKTNSTFLIIGRQ